MPTPISTASRSFIILFFVALVGTLLCLKLFSKEPTYQANLQQVTQSKPDNINTSSDNPTVDVSGWKSYTNSTYNFSFLYDPTWKILPAKKQGDYQVIQIDPGSKYYNIKIYISTTGYYAMSGLDSKVITVGGEKASDVDGLLYGVQSGQYYYTFDIGQSTVLKPEFDAMVHSLTFQN